MKAAILNPHFDDGIIGIGGIIVKLLKKNWELIYVYFTDGRHGGRLPPLTLKKIRRLEAERERNFLGIKNFFEFDIEDGKLERIGREKCRELVKKTCEIIRDCDVVFLPCKGDHHPDHRATHEIGCKAIDLAKSEILEVNYPIWTFPFRQYNPGKLEKILKINLSEKEFRKKLKAIRLHKSQVERRRYDKIVEKLNSFWALLYPSYRKTRWKYSEIVGIPRINCRYEKFVNAIRPVEDVTYVYHGRREKRIMA